MTILNTYLIKKKDLLRRVEAKLRLIMLITLKSIILLDKPVVDY